MSPMIQRTLLSLMTAGLLLGCSGDKPGSGDGESVGVGAMGGGVSFLREEPRGIGVRSSAELQLLGVGLDLSASYTGTRDEAAPEGGYVQCDFGNDPDNLGTQRLKVTAGHRGREPVFDATVRDVAASGPFSLQIPYAAGAAPQRVSVDVRHAQADGSVTLYEFGAGSFQTGSSYCFVQVVEFSRYQIAGSVACQRMQPGLDEATSSPISATLSFECPLGDAVVLPPKNEVTCTEGSEQSCFGDNDCSGVQICRGGAWASCDCPPEPRLTLKLLPPAASYASKMVQTTGSGLSGAAEALAAEGYVITAGTANTVPYTLYGVKPQGATELYEAVVIQPSGFGLSSAASTMAAAGYVPTVGMANEAPYTLIGVRPKGSITVYETLMRQTTGSGLTGVLSELAADGYVPTIAMANSVPYTVIGVRLKGSTKKYLATMLQTIGAGISGAATEMTSEGYVVIGAMTNASGYTLIGVKDASETWTLRAEVTQTIGAGLASTLTDLSGRGFIVLGATANSAPYSLFGTRAF